MFRYLLFVFMVLLSSCNEPPAAAISDSSRIIGSWRIEGYKDVHGWHQYKTRDYKHQTTEMVFSERRLDVFVYGTDSKGRYDNEFQSPVTYGENTIYLSRYYYFENGRLANTIPESLFLDSIQVINFGSRDVLIKDSLEYILRRFPN